MMGEAHGAAGVTWRWLLGVLVLCHVGSLGWSALTAVTDAPLRLLEAAYFGSVADPGTVRYGEADARYLQRKYESYKAAVGDHRAMRDAYVAYGDGEAARDGRRGAPEAPPRAQTPPEAQPEAQPPAGQSDELGGSYSEGMARAGEGPALGDSDGGVFGFDDAGGDFGAAAAADEDDDELAADDDLPALPARRVPAPVPSDPSELDATTTQGRLNRFKFEHQASVDDTGQPVAMPRSPVGIPVDGSGAGDAGEKAAPERPRRFDYNSTDEKSRRLHEQQRLEHQRRKQNPKHVDPHREATNKRENAKQARDEQRNKQRAKQRAEAQKGKEQASKRKKKKR